MPKKYKIEQRRAWLEESEKGKSDAAIADNHKIDIRTVKKGIEEARLERESRLARVELLKDALRDHQIELLSAVDDMMRFLALPPDNMIISWNEAGLLNPIPVPGATVKSDKEKHLVLIITSENSLKWEMLREHLKGDKIWKLIKQYKDEVLTHVNALVDLMIEAERLLQEKTGLKIYKGFDEKEPGIRPVALQMLYESALYKALERNFIGIEGRLVSKNDGYVRQGQGGTIYAYCPRDEEKCLNNILEAFAQLYKSRQSQQVKDTYSALDGLMQEARAVAEEIRLMKWLPNRCRVCKRLGM